MSILRSFCIYHVGLCRMPLDDIDEVSGAMLISNLTWLIAVIDLGLETNDLTNSVELSTTQEATSCAVSR
jgi:hypothetical protein